MKEGAGRLSGGAHSREREPHVQSPREGSVPSKLRNSTDVGRAGGKGLVGREGGEQSGQAAQSPAMGPCGPWGRRVSFVLQVMGSLGAEPGDGHGPTTFP